MTPAEQINALRAEIAKKDEQIEAQAELMKRGWHKTARAKRQRDYWRGKFEREANRPPTEEEIREAIFGGQSNG